MRSAVPIILLLATACGAATRDDGDDGAPAGVTIPALFHATWEFRTITSYPDDRPDPLVSSSTGTAVFKADGTYVQDYTVGSLGFNNHYEGTWKATGADPHTTGGFLIRTHDQDGQDEDWGVALDETIREMALTIYKADGRRDLVIGLKAKGE